MAQDKVDTWPSGSMALGVDVWTPDLASTLAVELDGTYNVTSGLAQGIGPRYGMAPLPGHADTEALTGQNLPGLMKAEQSSGTGLIKRTKVFGVIPLRLNSYDLATKGNFYAWIIGFKPAAQLYVEIVIGSRVPSSVYLQQEGISSGLPPDTATLISGGSVSFPMYELLPLLSSTQLASIQAFQAIDDTNALPFAVLSVSGNNNPMRFCFGKKITAASATKAPELNFWNVTGMTGLGTVVHCGLPPEYNLQTFKGGERQITFYCFQQTGVQQDLRYTHTITPTTSIFLQTPRVDEASKSMNLTGLTATKYGASVGYTSAYAALVEDGSAVCNSSYKAIALATPNGPKIGIIQDWLAGKSGELVQWVDPTTPRAIPRDKAYTTTYGGQTGFQDWPAFSEAAESATTVVYPAGANTGILRKNTSYEFCYSLFNKRTGYETNVSSPAKLRIGSTNDFQALVLWDPASASGYTPFEAFNVSGAYISPFPYVFDSLEINYYEYRVYYRALGSYEWIPAGSFDAAYFWFFPGHFATEHGKLRVCAGAVAGLPGGQPGGFVDYSPLPKDKYIDVVAWKDRLWWCSEKAICFSLERNVFAYAGRDSIAASAGDFRGITVHAYPGQAAQRGRLIIWGAAENYIAYFTGNLATQTVQISADSAGDFPIEASDLQIDPWTTMTAFSSRAAIVADGELYWWGPQGIFHDNGTDFPDRLSGPLEPDLFTLYASANCRDIHCIYNEATREITWFYTPRTADGYATHGLCYNTRSGNFLPLRFGSTVDASQRINIESSEKVSGNRTLLIARNGAVDPQRAYFFDERCRSGDVMPKTELMVKQISTPSAGLRRLTLATGYDATNFATIAVGDYIALHQALDYATSLTSADTMLAKVAAVGAGTIDITLPAGAALDTATLTRSTFMPIWHLGAASSGLNGIPWAARMTYWAPGGVRYFANWLYVYLLSRIVEWFFVDRPSINFTYRTPTSGGETTDTLELVDNADENWQCRHGLSGEEGGNTYGQALRMTLSGRHIGPEWVLQYLEAETTEDAGDGMQQFQG